MNILFPIGGVGERFKTSYALPKPLIEINGKPMIYWAVKSLSLSGQYIFTILDFKDKVLNNKIDDLLNEIIDNPKIIRIPEPTSGSACSSLYAEEFISNEEELIITNCDQYLNWNVHNFLNFIQNRKPDAIVSIYEHDDVVVNKPSPYCFVKVDAFGKVIDVCEKFAISDLSMNGIHYWKKGVDFVKTCKKMIENKITVNGEYYLSGSFKYMIEENKIILPYMMKEEEFYSLGTPEDIKKNIDKII